MRTRAAPQNETQRFRSGLEVGQPAPGLGEPESLCSTSRSRPKMTPCAKQARSRRKSLRTSDSSSRARLAILGGYHDYARVRVARRLRLATLLLPNACGHRPGRATRAPGRCTAEFDSSKLSQRHGVGTRWESALPRRIGRSAPHRLGHVGLVRHRSWLRNRRKDRLREKRIRPGAELRRDSAKAGDVPAGAHLLGSELGYPLGPGFAIAGSTTMFWRPRTHAPARLARTPPRHARPTEPGGEEVRPAGRTACWVASRNDAAFSALGRNLAGE